MATGQNSATGGKREATLVLYCLVRTQDPGGGPVRFLLVPKKKGEPSFPPTRLRPGEDLYRALVRPMEEDLGLAAGSYFPEEELEAIRRAEEGPRYAGLPDQWHLYPVHVSLTNETRSQLEQPEDSRFWWTVEEILKQAKEPNVLAIAGQLVKNHEAQEKPCENEKPCDREKPPDLLTAPVGQPSMDALACHWVASQSGGARVLRRQDIDRVLAAGDRAFNLRVADPYFAYHKQGLGFTWSFFTAKDKQDVHVHGLPAVEIYGVIEGRLQLWHKPMNQRGVWTWQCRTLGPGDWAEVEPLECHFACWAQREGLGTVIKAAGAGELAGVGKLGVAGKTTCDDCNMKDQCNRHPGMEELVKQYAKSRDDRDYDRIARLIEHNQGVYEMERPHAGEHDG